MEPDQRAAEAKATAHSEGQFYTDYQSIYKEHVYDTVIQKLFQVDIAALGAHTRAKNQLMIVD